MMKWIAYVGLLFSCGILLMVACIAPETVPVQSLQPSGKAQPLTMISSMLEQPPEYLINSTGIGQTIRYTVTRASMIINDSKKRIIGCKTIVPFDGREAFDRYPRNHLILWTFTVNFDLLSEAGNPLGCLHLYRRNFDPGTVDRGTFELIERGNILVDTCRVKSKTLTGSVPGVTFNSGSARFGGAGYIVCEMNLSDWIEKLSSRINLTVTQSGIGVAHGTETFTSTHTYANFTIAASIVPTETNKGSLLPLVYYRPKDSSKAKPALVLESVQNTPIRLSAEGCELVGTSPISPSWWYGKQMWWYDLRQERANQKPDLLYTLNFLREPADYHKYVRSCQIDNQLPLEFSLEEAKLYIGYDPRTKQIFMGTINGILVDPTDSKPEKS